MTTKDSTPRTLYVHRKVTNPSDILSWAKDQGFESTLPADDLHVTVAFSRTPVDWMSIGEDWDPEVVVTPGGPRQLERFGTAGDAVVLLFASSSLMWRHEIMKAAGASWDHPEYQPHITLTYDGAALDLDAIEPYQGEIRLGPEVFQEVKEDWKETIVETTMADRRMIDVAVVNGTRITSDGYMIADAVVARTGIQQYHASELGIMSNDVIKVYRPEEEVKDEKSVHTYTHAPITMGHPDEMVTADNWADLAKGEVSTDATWEDGRIRLPLIVKDAEAIKAIEDGVRELSAGYTCDLDWTPGTTPEGEAYDAVQRKIRINHVAIVPRGRAGVARIGDSQPWGAAPLSDARKDGLSMPDTLQNMAFLGDAYSLNPDGVKLKTAADAAIEAKDTEVADANKRADDALETIKAKDGEIAALTKQLEDAKVTPEMMDKAIAERAKTMDLAKGMGMSDEDMKGKTEEEIKKDSVSKKLGDTAKDWGAVQINAAFATLAKDVKPGSSLQGALDQSTEVVTDLSDAYQARTQRLSDGWKGKQKEAV